MPYVPADELVWQQIMLVEGGTCRGKSKDTHVLGPSCPAGQSQVLHRQASGRGPNNMWSCGNRTTQRGVSFGALV